MRWYDYLHREVIEIKGNILRLASEQGVEVYILNRQAVPRITAGLTCHYRTKRKPGRRPRWLVELEARL